LRRAALRWSAGKELEVDRQGLCATAHNAALHRIEVVEGFVGIANRGLFAPAIEQTLATRSGFITDQASDEINGRHGFGLSLVETS